MGLLSLAIIGGVAFVVYKVVELITRSRLPAMIRDVLRQVQTQKSKKLLAGVMEGYVKQIGDDYITLEMLDLISEERAEVTIQGEGVDASIYQLMPVSVF